MKTKIAITIFLIFSLNGFSQNSFNKLIDAQKNDADKLSKILETSYTLLDDYMCNSNDIVISRDGMVIKKVTCNCLSAEQYVALLKKDIYFFFKYKTSEYEESFLYFKYSSELQKKVFKNTEEYKNLLDSLIKFRDNAVFCLYTDKFPDYTIEEDKSLSLQGNSYIIREYNVDFSLQNVFEKLYESDFSFSKLPSKSTESNVGRKKLDYVSISVPEEIAINIENNKKNISVLILFDFYHNFERVIFADLNTMKIYFDKIF
jgi:hypothetical protein